MRLDGPMLTVNPLRVASSRSHHTPSGTKKQRMLLTCGLSFTIP
jgi:hypothetical protein